MDWRSTRHGKHESACSVIPSPFFLRQGGEGALTDVLKVDRRYRGGEVVLVKRPYDGNLQVVGAGEPFAEEPAFPSLHLVEEFFLLDIGLYAVLDKGENRLAAARLAIFLVSCRKPGLLNRAI